MEVLHVCFATLHGRHACARLDQYAFFHSGAERSLTEDATIRVGFAHANSPVPSSTLTPLNAAILSNEISTGLTWRHGRSRYEAAYLFRPEASQSVTKSSLLAGEYDNSFVHVGTQSVILSYALQF